MLWQLSLLLVFPDISATKGTSHKCPSHLPLLAEVSQPLAAAGIWEETEEMQNPGKQQAPSKVEFRIYHNVISSWPRISPLVNGRTWKASLANCAGLLQTVIHVPNKPSVFWEQTDVIVVQMSLMGNKQSRTGICSAHRNTTSQ